MLNFYFNQFNKNVFSMFMLVYWKIITKATLLRILPLEVDQRTNHPWVAECSARTMKLEGHPLFVDNGVPLQLYCPSQASAAYATTFY